MYRRETDDTQAKVKTDSASDRCCEAHEAGRGGREGLGGSCRQCAQRRPPGATFGKEIKVRNSQLGDSGQAEVLQREQGGCVLGTE